MCENRLVRIGNLTTAKDGEFLSQSCEQASYVGYVSIVSAPGKGVIQRLSLA